MTRPVLDEIQAQIYRFLHAVDIAMTDEGINGHTRRRVLNRWIFGQPDGDPDIQIAVLEDRPSP